MNQTYSAYQAHGW